MTFHCLANGLNLDNKLYYSLCFLSISSLSFFLPQFPCASFRDYFPTRTVAVPPPPTPTRSSCPLLTCCSVPFPQPDQVVPYSPVAAFPSPTRSSCPLLTCCSILFPNQIKLSPTHLLQHSLPQQDQVVPYSPVAAFPSPTRSSCPLLTCCSILFPQPQPNQVVPYSPVAAFPSPTRSSCLYSPVWMGPLPAGKCVGGKSTVNNCKVCPWRKISM